MPGEVFTVSNIGNTVTNVYKRGRQRNCRKRTLNLITASSYLPGYFAFWLTCQCPKTLVRVFAAFCISSSGPALSWVKGLALPRLSGRLPFAVTLPFSLRWCQCYAVLCGFDAAQMEAVTLVLSFRSRQHVCFCGSPFSPTMALHFLPTCIVINVLALNT